jgi:hypothetical protein
MTLPDYDAWLERPYTSRADRLEAEEAEREYDDEEIAEEKLRARDYEAWADL